MLQIVGDTQTGTETKEKTDDALYCARCEALVTRTRWAISMDGHEHVFFNPAGVVFRVLCFKDAPGARDRGQPSDEFTWFKGYDWTIAVCAECGEHLGWRYTGEGDPALFFGLIKNKMTSQASGQASEPDHD